MRSAAASQEIGNDVQEKVNPAYVITKCYFGVIPFLFISAWLTYLDRGSISFGSLQFKKTLNLSSADYGLGSGLFYIGYAAFQIPSNWVLHRVGAPRWLALLTLLWGLVSTVSAAMKTRAQFFVVRFFLGMTEAGFFPGAWYHMNLFYNSWEIGVAYACTAAATTIGQLLGAPIAAGILLMDGQRGLEGWQWIFIIEGTLTMVWAFVFLVTLSRGPDVAWFLSPAERTWLAQRQARHLAEAEALNPKGGTWRAILYTWKIWYLSFCFMLISFSIAVIIYFNPLIIQAMFSGGWGMTKPQIFKTPRDKVLHDSHIALVSAILWIPVSISLVVGGFSTKHFRDRNYHCGIPLAIGGVCYMLVTTALEKSGPIAGYAVLIIGATAVEFCGGAIWSWARTFLHGEGVAIGIALYNTIGTGLGGFLGPSIVGWLVGLPNGYRTCMIVLGAVNFIAAVLLFWFRPDVMPEKDGDVGDIPYVTSQGEMGQPSSPHPKPATAV